MTQFNEVRELILKLPRYEDVEDLKLYVSENIEKFRDDNIMFNEGFAHQKEIIRRYDEVLTMKANNQTIIEMNGAIRKTIEEQIKEVC